MGNDKYYDEILSYITEHGETGVNVLAKELNVPLSTMQRYLERQTYFRKTVNRRWDVPDNVDTDIKANTMSLMVTSVENALMLIDAQMSEVRSSIQNALMPVNTLKRAVNVTFTPVADKSPDIDKRLLKIDEDANKIYDIIKKKKADIPEEYRDVLFNVDYVGLVLGMGETYAIELFSNDVYTVLAGKDTVISEEAVETLKEYQKGDKS